MDSAIRFDRARVRPRELVPALVCSLGVESGVMSDEGGGAAEGALGGPMVGSLVGPMVGSLSLDPKTHQYTQQASQKHQR